MELYKQDDQAQKAQKKVSMSLLPVNCRVYGKFKSQISGDHHLLNFYHKGYFLTASVMGTGPLFKRDQDP